MWARLVECKDGQRVEISRTRKLSRSGSSLSCGTVPGPSGNVNYVTGTGFTVRFEERALGCPEESE
jgi:hypothetical protein